MACKHHGLYAEKIDILVLVIFVLTFYFNSS